MALKERFSTANNFALYYGRDESKKLSGFDIAIVEPLGQTKDTIKTIKDSGTLVLSYLSVMEIHEWSPEFSFLTKKDFMHIDGKQLLNNEFQTYMTDLRSKKWLDILYHNIRNLVDYGYDGIFFDTVGDIETAHIPIKIQIKLVNSFVKLLKRVRKVSKDIILIQNNGLGHVCNSTYPYLNGICWENPQFARTEVAPWASNILDKLVNMKKETGFQTLLLMEEDNLIDADITLVWNENISLLNKIAMKNNFLSYISPRGYTSGVNPVYFTK